MQKTLAQFDLILARCEALFVQKNKDYGTAWRILRPSSLTDQIFIKAKRVRSIEEKGYQEINDSIESEFIGIVNYCILSLIQLQLPADAPLDLPEEEAHMLYKSMAKKIVELLRAKNDDYGEAWRDMRPTSYTDLILMKLMRIKQIEDNAGKTLVSEGLEANYMDIANYAIFALIKMEEAKEKTVQP